MPIQFRCSGCGQPIEVDDEHAGKMAACPYCQRVVAVPQASTFEGGPIPAARPAGAPAAAEPLPSQPQAWEPGPPDPRQETARRYGRYALLCLALAAVFIIITLAMSWPVVAEVMRTSTAQPGEIPSGQLDELMGSLRNRPALVALNCASELLVVIALALSVTSVAQARRNNPTGIVALVLSGLLTLCICGGIYLTMAGAMAS